MMEIVVAPIRERAVGSAGRPGGSLVPPMHPSAGLFQCQFDAAVRMGGIRSRRPERVIIAGLSPAFRHDFGNSAHEDPASARCRARRYASQKMKGSRSRPHPGSHPLNPPTARPGSAPVPAIRHVLRST